MRQRIQLTHWQYRGRKLKLTYIYIYIPSWSTCKTSQWASWNNFIILDILVVNYPVAEREFSYIQSDSFFLFNISEWPQWLDCVGLNNLDGQSGLLGSAPLGNMAIWISWNTDIRRSLNSSDSFPRRKFENRAPTSCRPCPILSWSAIRFELHAKMVEEIDLDYSIVGLVMTWRYIQWKEKINMAIWILWNIDIRRSLNSRDSFPRRKFENWAPTSCRPCPILNMSQTWSAIRFELHAKMVEEIDLEKCNFRNFRWSLTLTKDIK